jgi:dihydrodipicolinate synthase/N-acetylneuraminate lyase
MEKGVTGSIDGLLQLGLPGIVIIALGFVCWRLHKLYTEVQEKRIAEGREAVKAMEQTTAALENLSEVIRSRRA